MISIRRLWLILVVLFLVVGSLAQESERIQISLFTTESDETQLTALAEIIEAYQVDHPNIRITVETGTPATRGQRTNDLFEAGLDAGIFELEPVLASQWASNGYLLLLDETVEQIGGLGAYTAGSLSLYNGSVYALPYAASVYGLWYRKDLFEAAGLDVPRNYAELIDVAAALTKPDEGIYGLSMPGATNSSVAFFSVMLWQNCLDYYTTSGDLVFDEPRVLDVIENWLALSAYAPPEFIDWTWGDQITAFTTGQVAMSIYAGRMGLRIVSDAPDLEALADVSRIPLSFTENAPYVTYGSWSRFSIDANTAYPEESKDFLRFFLSGLELARFDGTVPGHMVPPLVDVGFVIGQMDSEYVNNHHEWISFFNNDVAYINHPSNNMGAVDGCDFSPQLAVTPWGGEIFSSGGTIDRMLHSIFIGEKTADAAWQDAIAEMRRIHDEWEG